jgi:hypothetical protein
VIIASENLSPSLTKFIESSGKPFLPFAPKDAFAEAYTDFYKTYGSLKSNFTTLNINNNSFFKQVVILTSIVLLLHVVRDYQGFEVANLIR